jgi:DNA uptake protein ComE-like DNA-binding protein
VQFEKSGAQTRANLTAGGKSPPIVKAQCRSQPAPRAPFLYSIIRRNAEEKEMRKVLLAALVLVLGGTAVASAQSTPTAPPKADSASRWAHDSGMKQGATMGDTAMKRAGQVASLDVNTASREQIEAVPALKPYADKIIAGRPYTSVKQLEEKQIVPKDVLNSTKSKLTVGSD